MSFAQLDESLSKFNNNGVEMLVNSIKDVIFKLTYQL